MARPAKLAVRLGWYMVKNGLVKRRKRFPLVTMLEPLEACNLACDGCGRLREYESVLHRRLTPDECMAAVEESGAPIVSVTGGEPTIHPQIAEIVSRIIRQKKFVYLCTTGLLMGRVMEQVPPSTYLCWVVHLDGTAEPHDRAVRRDGVYAIARETGVRFTLDSDAHTLDTVGDGLRSLHVLARLGFAAEDLVDYEGLMALKRGKSR